VNAGKMYGQFWVNYAAFEQRFDLEKMKT